MERRLKTWLSDSVARVILIDKTFDFSNSEGSTTKEVCRDSITGACPGGTTTGQNTIGDTCDRGSWVSGTFENAGRSGLKVASNKSIVGVGNKGIIVGKGFSLTGGVSNIIIQNVHFYVSFILTFFFDAAPDIWYRNLEHKPRICLGWRYDNSFWMR